MMAAKVKKLTQKDVHQVVDVPHVPFLFPNGAGTKGVTYIIIDVTSTAEPTIFDNEASLEHLRCRVEASAKLSDFTKETPCRKD